MSFLSRTCNLGTCYRYMTVINALQRRQLCAAPFLNLTKYGPPVYCKLFSSETNVLLSDVSVRKCLDYITNAYNSKDSKIETINEVLSVHSVRNLLTKKMRIIDDIKSLQDLVTDDSEMKKLAEEDQAIYRKQIDEIDEKLLDALLQNLGKQYFKSVIVEITPGVGGQEAMLFVKDLCNMYIGYCDYLGFSYEVMELDTTDQGGVRKASIVVSDEAAFDKFKYEGGVHRVQRIPTTERSGRIHTSTASVAVLPEPSDIEITLPEKDLKIETKRASGAGGQHVNTTDSAIRIVHIPSGTTVNCQIGKSQLKNRVWALAKLRSILYEQKLEKQVSLISSLRKKQMGMGSRNEKIRTYNYSQDRITDHRIQNGTMHNLSGFMLGGSALEELEDRLHKDVQKNILLEIAQNLESQLK